MSELNGADLFLRDLHRGCGVSRKSGAPTGAVAGGTRGAELSCRGLGTVCASRPVDEQSLSPANFGGASRSCLDFPLAAVPAAADNARLDRCRLSGLSRCTPGSLVGSFRSTTRS
jgi:hypothetical protein